MLLISNLEFGIDFHDNLPIFQLLIIQNEINVEKIPTSI